MKHIYYHLKLPSCSQLISLNKYLEKLAYIYYRNAFYVAICVEFERKNNTIMALLLSNCLQVLTIFYDWLLEYYFWWFRHICLLGYRIKFSCLHIPHGHYFLGTLWLWNKMNLYFFSILSESPPLISFTFLPCNKVSPLQSEVKHCLQKS